MTEGSPSSPAVAVEERPSARARYLPLPAAPLVAPDLVPARMLNELMYCERLMYLEWVQGEFADVPYNMATDKKDLETALPPFTNGGPIEAP